MEPRTILVADEDTDTRIILRTLLERHGFTVVEAATAQQAVDQPNDALSLIIMNHPMLVSENLTLAEWFRAQVSTAAVPIVNLTSRPVPAFLSQAMQQGVTVTMSKPIDVQRMLQTVAELIKPLVPR